MLALVASTLGRRGAARLVVPVGVNVRAHLCFDLHCSCSWSSHHTLHWCIRCNRFQNNQELQHANYHPRQRNTLTLLELSQSMGVMLENHVRSSLVDTSPSLCKWKSQNQNFTACINNSRMMWLEWALDALMQLIQNWSRWSLRLVVSSFWCMSYHHNGCELTYRYGFD